MTRSSLRHWCRDCGAETVKWQGQCPACHAWNSLEAIDLRPATVRTGTLVGAGGPTLVDAQPRPVAEVPVGAWRTAPTGLYEVDRVLGGGLVPGSVTLLGGPPGIGKSTLALQLAGTAAAAGDRVLYLSGEESVVQVRSRAGRLEAIAEELWLGPGAVLDEVVAAVARAEARLVVLDSIQTCVDSALGGTAGSVAQVREVVDRLVGAAKSSPCTVVLVGHVTKEGHLAGPKVVEHLVDTVLTFEGDRGHALRLLRASKHRFGSTGELGVFEMTATGLRAVPDPSALFLADRVRGVPGSVVVPTLEGHRPLMVEVQALTVPSSLASPRRSTQGFDASRLAMLLAVLARRGGVGVGTHDVYASAVGGAQVAEPGADLALVLAVASAITGEVVPDDVVVCGEVGLAGEVRRVAHLERRLGEAARLGFGRAVVPIAAPVPPSLDAIEVASVAEALDAFRLRVSGHGGRRA